MPGKPYGERPGYPVKIPDLYKLSLVGRIPTGWRSPQPGVKDPAALPKSTNGTQVNRTPLFPNPDA